MSAVPSPIAPATSRPSGSDTPKLATKAAVVLLRRRRSRRPSRCRSLSRLSPHTPGLGDVRHPRHDRGRRAALRRAHAAQPVVPHDDRLPDPGRDAAPAGARRADRRRPAHSGVAEEPQRLVHPDLQHLQLRSSIAARPTRPSTASCGLGSSSDVRLRARRPRRGRLDRRRSTTRCWRRCCASRAATRSASRACSRSRASRPSSCSPCSASSMAAFWTLEPVADPVRRRAAAPDPPLARACRSSRRRRASTRRRASSTRGTSRAALNEELVRARALRAAALAGDGRPRPAARHQQHLRPPRRRRGPAGHRRGLPRAAAPLRRAARFGGEEFAILLPGDAAGAGLRDRRADPPHGRRAARSTSRPRASRSGDGLDRHRRVPARRQRLRTS